MSSQGAPIPSMTTPLPEPDNEPVDGPDSAVDLANIERSVSSSSLARVRTLALSHPSRAAEVIRGWLGEGSTSGN